MKHSGRFASYVLVALMCLSIPGIANAIALDIISSPKETSGGFQHNVFHKPGGKVLAWYDLDLSALNQYDPETGAISASFNLFNTSNFCHAPIGTATAVGLLPGDGFNSDDGSVAGTITWTITVGKSKLRHYLKKNFGEQSEYTTTTTFLDSFMATSNAGYVANSWQDDALTLWGGDGYMDGKGYDPTNYKLGTDLVLLTSPYDDVVAAPVPAAVWLFGSGLIGLVSVARRRTATV